MKQRTEHPRRGRPRGFDADEVLDRAMRVFWRKGYASASLSDLTVAMGINRASMYGAFGDKESLFRRVLDRYVLGPFSYFRQSLEAATALAVAESLLRGGANLATDARNPTGCLWVRGALSHGDGPVGLRREMAVRRKAALQHLEQRFARAIEEGDLPADTDPAELARFLQAVHLGMQVQAATGASRAELDQAVRGALRALPK